MGRQVGQHKQPDSGGGRQHDALASNSLNENRSFLRFRPDFDIQNSVPNPQFVFIVQAKLNGGLMFSVAILPRRDRMDFLNQSCFRER